MLAFPDTSLAWIAVAGPVLAAWEEVAAVAIAGSLGKSVYRCCPWRLRREDGVGFDSAMTVVTVVWRGIWWSTCERRRFHQQVSRSAARVVGGYAHPQKRRDACRLAAFESGLAQVGLAWEQGIVEG